MTDYETYDDTHCDLMFNTAYDVDSDGWVDSDRWVDTDYGFTTDVYTGQPPLASWTPPAGVPVDSIVSDVLGDMGSTDYLVDSVLADLPPAGIGSVSSDTASTLDFINGGGSVLTGMIGDLESGNDFSEAELDWANQRINGGGNTLLWDVITDGNNTSNEIRQGQLDDMYEQRELRDAYDDWDLQRNIQEVIDVSEWLYQDTRYAGF